MRALLDTNVLIALFEPGHQFHGRARVWLADHAKAGWASCPLTQNGFVRIVSGSGYPLRVSPTEAMERLARATKHQNHEFWPDDISILDEAIVNRKRIHGAKQLTDCYLLALAVKNKGCLATFDESVPLSAVRGATPKHLRPL